MHKKIINSIFIYFTNFLELQLVITLMSLPILIHWGLAISCLSPLANLIFTPLLILFLWISCIFSMCALLHIPCSILTYLLNSIANFWLWLLSFSHPSWLLGFSHTNLWLSICICISIIILYTFIKPTTKRSVLILIGLCLCMITCRWYSTKNFYHQFKDLPMIAMRIHDKNYLIDYGALCCKQNFYSNIDYSIIPELIKQTGITNIDTLVLYKPSPRLAKVVLQFAQQTNVTTIIAPTAKNCYKILSIACKDNNNIKILPLQKQRKKKSSIW